MSERYDTIEEKIGNLSEIMDGFRFIYSLG
ncbi:hypothetical protein ABIB40_000190 [Pedobacter sp. UYP30]